MTEQGTVTATEQPGSTEEQQAAEVATQAAAETATAETEQAGQQTEEEKAAAEKTKAEAEAEQEEQEFHKRFPKAQEKINRKIDAAKGSAKAAQEEAIKAREEAAYLRGKLEALEAKGGTDRKDTAIDPGLDPADPKPDEGEFESNAEYVEALTDWKLRANERRTEVRARQSSAAQKVEALVNDGRARYQDWDTRVLKNAAFTRLPGHVADFIVASDHPADVTYHLADDKERARILSLPPIQAIKELAKIEAGIAGKRSPVAPAAPAKKTPPAPPATVSGSGGSSNIDVKNLSMEQQAALMGASD